MDSMTLEEKIVRELEKKGYTITTAESCTGGLLAGRILNVSGASSVYNEGHITYSNEAKQRILGVSHETLKTYGAVSRQTAAEMAKGAARVANANVGLSTTGIAGPGGGTPEQDKYSFKPLSRIISQKGMTEWNTYLICRISVRHSPALRLWIRWNST